MSNSKDIKSLFRKQLGSKFPQAKLDAKLKSSKVEISHDKIRKRKFKENDSIEPVKVKSILKNKIDVPVVNVQSCSGKPTSDKKVKFDNNSEISLKSVDNKEEQNVPEARPNDVMSIPEGFFDDPHLELKTKKVLPKTKTDEDYELFIKSIDAVSKENEEKMEQESQNDTVKLQIVENINETFIWNEFNNFTNSLEESKSSLPTVDNQKDSTSDSSSGDSSDENDILWRNKSNCKFN